MLDSKPGGCAEVTLRDPLINEATTSSTKKAEHFYFLLISWLFICHVPCVCVLCYGHTQHMGEVGIQIKGRKTIAWVE